MTNPVLDELAGQRRRWMAVASDGKLEGYAGRFSSVLSSGRLGEQQEHTVRCFALWRPHEDVAWRIERYVDGVRSGRFVG